MRRRFEPRFGHDFSRVRIHTGDEAAASAQSLGARAYTAGDHVVFGAGEYAPHTTNGARLIAHELTHVVQQRHRVSDPMEHGESEADRVANGSTERVTVGSTAPVQMQRADRPIAPAVSTAVAKPVIQNFEDKGCTPRSDYFHYGCYCGSGSSCPSFQCKGIDNLDECCRDHDREYGDCDITDRYLGTARCKARIAAADTRFCACLSLIVATSKGEKKDFAERAIFLFCKGGVIAPDQPLPGKADPLRKEPLRA
ncbi:MAG TPA: DUF4157 domain-containing protein [Thermoanaerobaculia bacterium]|jgi:hypothetical protein|nr:DUF4157 domain-containing protein [Thermoanaerobaculia bacterium]